MEKDECIKEFNTWVQAKQKKERDKKWKAEKKILKIKTHATEYKRELQNNINKLARLIDKVFNYNCIDCNLPFTVQTDAAHYHPRSTHNSLRYHLDNLHSARSNCNMWSPEHKTGYAKGLQQRYGAEYLEYIEGLPRAYPKIKLNENEVVEKLSIARGLIRNFDTFKFEDGRQARKVLNGLIGIY